jgi:hypothetical protein
MLRAAILIAAFAGGAALAAVATAGTPSPACPAGKPRALILTQLQRDFSEHPTHIGVTSKGGVLEVIATDDGSTWTVLLSSPQGCTSVVAAGEGWDRVPPPLAGRES